MGTIPRRLRTDPIIEAVAEIRFKPTPPQGASAILPGYFYPKVRDRFPKLVPQPISQMPAAFRATDPALRYATLHHLVGDNCTLMLGDRALAVSVDAPYPGWASFKDLVSSLWREGGKSGVIGEIERISVRYINLLDGPPRSDHFALTNVTVTMANKVLSSEPTLIRTEITDDSLTTIIEMVFQATASDQKAGVTRHGALLAVDSILNGPLPDFWNRMDVYLDRVHSAEKEAFFGLLSAATLERYGPEY